MEKLSGWVCLGAFVIFLCYIAYEIRTTVQRICDYQLQKSRIKALEEEVAELKKQKSPPGCPSGLS